MVTRPAELGSKPQCLAFHTHWSGSLAHKSDGNETQRSPQTQAFTKPAESPPPGCCRAAAGAVAGAVAAGAAAPGSILGLAA